MNTQQLLPLLSLFIYTLSIAANPASLKSLVDSKLVEVVVQGEGNHSGECLHLIAENIVDSSLTVRIEPGRIFNSENPLEQDIIVTQELIFALSPEGKTEIDVFGFCCQSQNFNPNTGAGFRIGDMADEHLLKVAEYLNEHRDLSISQQQSAIWCLSDCAPVSSISRSADGNSSLNEFVSEILGIDPPWYTTIHKQTANAVFSEHIQKLYGDLEFEVDSYKKVNVNVLDLEGKMVTTLLREAVYGPGEYTYPISVWVDHWRSGDYSIEITADNSEVLATYDFSI